MKQWDRFLSGDNNCFAFFFQLRRLIFSVCSEFKSLVPMASFWRHPQDAHGGFLAAFQVPFNGNCSQEYAIKIGMKIRQSLREIFRKMQIKVKIMFSINIEH